MSAGKSFPESEELSRLFKNVTQDAYKSALDAGIPVTIARGGTIYKVQKIGNDIRYTKVKDVVKSAGALLAASAFLNK